MINFCHIAPTSTLKTFCIGRSFHLALAHLIETDDEYTQFYRTEKQTNDCTIIMDNSAFEMYKQGREMYPSNKLIEMGNKIRADYIVMSDYPGQASKVTIQAAQNMAPQLKAAGFGTFFVPQSEEGDIQDYLGAYEWAADNPDLVDYIGVSILGAPLAFGVERDNKLQRFMSRWEVMRLLEQRGTLERIRNNGQKIHFLGMVDGPKEIALVQKYHDYINTWDSSAAIWAGLNGVSFDSSPTGLINGKFEQEVDFNYIMPEDSNNCVNELLITLRNINVINEMCGEPV